MEAGRGLPEQWHLDQRHGGGGLPGWRCGRRWHRGGMLPSQQHRDRERYGWCHYLTWGSLADGANATGATLARAEDKGSLARGEEGV